MKIGILTYHRAKNYGAFLQAYGLCSRLNQQENIEAEIIDFQMKKEKMVYSLNKDLKFKILHFREYNFLKSLYREFDESINMLPKSKEYMCSDDLYQFQNFIENKYDIVIVGSDEVWKIDGFRGFPTPYWLPNDYKCKKISYAASSRNDLTLLPKEIFQKLQNFLKDFSLISVRDSISYNQINNNVILNCKLLKSCDPSFIFNYKLNGKLGRNIIIERLNLNSNVKIALIMTEDRNVARKIYEEYSKEYKLISVFHWHKKFLNIPKLNPFEWANAIAGADIVFTSYFHATCFSIISNTKFVSFGTKIKSEKLIEILKESNNMENFVDINKLNQNDGRNYLQKIVNNVKNKNINNKKFLEECNMNFNEFLKELNLIIKEK